MDSPLVDALTRLGPLDLAFLIAAFLLVFWLSLTRRTYALIFILVLSASFAGTTIPILDATASLVRWAAIPLIVLSGRHLPARFVPRGYLFFLGYAVLGFVFLFAAISPAWQLQRALLLLAVATAIPFAYSTASEGDFRSSLVSISVAAALVPIINLPSFHSALGTSARFSGYAAGAPLFAASLGALLPFSLWGSLIAIPRSLKLLCATGFLLGLFQLLLSGQRAGTVAGMVAVLPLVLLHGLRRGKLRATLALALLLVMSAGAVMRSISTEKLEFLQGRYRLEAGVSDRDLIWKSAYRQIARSPLLGRGTGAAERAFDGNSYHSSYLEAWFNTSPLGLMLFVGSQIYLLFRIRFLFRRAKDPETRSILALSLGYLAGFVFLGIFESVGAGASNVNVVLYIFLSVMLSQDVLCANSAASVRRLRSFVPQTAATRGYKLRAGA